MKTYPQFCASFPCCAKHFRRLSSSTFPKGTLSWNAYSHQVRLQDLDEGSRVEAH